MPIPDVRSDEYREVAWGINKCGEKFTPIYINRLLVRDFDVKIDIHFCGICHSDVHCGLNELGGTKYPVVPGHEMVGVVTEIGGKVTKVKVGDKAGIGCITDACLDCEACENNDENYCMKFGICGTYNSIKKPDGHYGGNLAT